MCSGLVISETMKHVLQTATVPTSNWYRALKIHCPAKGPVSTIHLSQFEEENKALKYEVLKYEWLTYRVFPCLPPAKMITNAFHVCDPEQCWEANAIANHATEPTFRYLSRSRQFGCSHENITKNKKTWNFIHASTKITYNNKRRQKNGGDPSALSAPPGGHITWKISTFNLVAPLSTIREMKA